MANNINWGKIYGSTWWGNVTNTISWGKSYSSLAGTITTLASRFKERVLALGGFVESEECIDESVDASLYLKPSGYSDGKVYTALPEDGSGDMDFARASGGTRINAQGEIENVNTLGDELVTNGTFETILGNELVTNGGFDTDVSGWNPLSGVLFDFESGDVDGRIGVAKFDANSVNAGRVTQTINTIIGQTYRVSATTKYISGDPTHIEVEGLVEYPNGIVIFNGLDWKDSFFDFVATSTTHTIAIRERGGVNNASCYVDDISVTSFIEGYIDDTELVTNGGFDDGSSDWGLQSGWSIVTDSNGNNVAKCVTTGSTGLFQNAGLESGKTYRISYDITEYNSGKIRVEAENSSRGEFRDDIGSYVDYLTTSTATSNRPLFRNSESGGFDGSIDNISVKEVVQDNWVLGTGWSIGNNEISNSGSSVNFNQNIGNFLGKKVLVEFDVTDISNSSFIKAELGGASGAFKSDEGRYSTILEPTNSSSILYIYGSPFEGTIDNISVKEVIEEGIPRLDYTDGGCPSLLLEPQSTNLYSNSEPTVNEGAAGNVTYESFAWANGFTNCVKFGNNSIIRYRYGGIALANTTQTLSCYVIMDDLSEPVVSSDANNNSADFTLVTRGTASGNANTNIYLGDNIWRVSKTFDSTTINLSDNGVVKYIGQSSKGFRLVGWQLEALPYATSYITTSGGIATRVAETLERDNISHLINSEEGVLYVEMKGSTHSGGLSQNTGKIITLSDGTDENRVGVLLDYRYNRVGFTIAIDDVLNVYYYTVGESIVDYNKYALSYNDNRLKGYLNGVEVVSEIISLPSSFNLTRLGFDNGRRIYPFYGNIKDLRIYKTALTDQELTDLTTI
jgi:hypothetical protein